MHKEVKALKSELAWVKLQFNERINAVESRLDEILAQDDRQADINTHPFGEIKEMACAVLNLEHPQNEIQLTKPVITAEEYIATRAVVEKSKPSTPSFITLFFHAILSSLFDWFSPVAKIYQSYKARGMLGLFILTIVGLSLTLAGFGYLMQLLIDQLGAGSKSLLMCIAAVGVMGLGIGLKIKTRFSEFATAIVSLGILLCYSTVYFSGSVYGLLPNIAVLFLYFFIAVLCHVVALKLETNIVAALGIIGIATMPILSNTLQLESLYYLFSLAFITASSLTLAYRYIGQWLANLSLTFSLLAIEWIISNGVVDLSAWTVNLFYLMFFAYAAISLFNQKIDDKKILVFLAALIGATLVLFLQASDLFSGQMSVCFALNALIAVGISVLFYKVKHQLTHFIILLGAMWTVLAIVSAIGETYWGIAWAIEGLLLLYIGSKYRLTSVIHQGQILTALALIYSFIALAGYFPLPALISVDGWILSIVIAAVIGLWQRMINPNGVFDSITLNKIKPILQLLESVWLVTLLIASADIGLGNWTGVLVIVIQGALLFRAKYCRQISIEIFAAGLILVPLFYGYQGALMVDSFRFTLLPLFAKCSVVSAFAQLWLWSAFYRKYQPESAVKHIAELVRILFYLLIPVCWLGSTIRRLDENSLMIVWLSPVLALFFAEKIKHHILIKEAKLLTVLASLFFMVVIGQLNLLNSIIALTGFIAFYALAFFLNKKEHSSDLSQFICSSAIIALGFALPNLIGFQTDNLFFGLLSAAIYWITAFNAITLNEHVKRNEKTITFINLFILSAAWFMTLFSGYSAIIPCLFILAAMHQKQHKFDQTWLYSLLGINSDLLLHSIAAITYVVLMVSLNEYRLDLLIAPILAVHGALILFMKDRRIITVKYSFVLILLGIVKLTLVDAASTLLWQKVVLFMGVGVFILAASFWYQKLISKTDVI